VLPAVDVGKVRLARRRQGAARGLPRRGRRPQTRLRAVRGTRDFARFGARLDEDTRKIIEHGRRIRACLKQAGSRPGPVPAQITVLLALTADLFDPVPLDQMTAAEQAVQEAATEFPPKWARVSKAPTS
jgi:F-type H+-transporting ATPase subunit alpha